MSYGKELIIDMQECNTNKFNRQGIKEYLIELCKKIDMKREKLYWWDYEDDIEAYDNAPAHLKGTSCVQFISTSNITIHTLDDLRKVFINIFSCKDFHDLAVMMYSADFFRGHICNYAVVDRL